MAHVLVVDDQKDICEVLKAGIETADQFYVSCSNRGAEAISILEEHRPDFAVVDVLIPDVSGIAVAQVAVDHGIPLLLITGNPETAHEFRGSQVPHLLKPFRLGALLAEVRQQLAEPDDNLRRVRAYLAARAATRPPIR